MLQRRLRQKTTWLAPPQKKQRKPQVCQGKYRYILNHSLLGHREFQNAFKLQIIDWMFPFWPLVLPPISFDEVLPLTLNSPYQHRCQYCNEGFHNAGLF